MAINSVNQVKKILSLQFPDLKIEGIKLLGEGANNCAYEINGEYVFRFPKNLKAEKDCQKEIFLLNALRPSLNLLTPEFEFIGNSKKIWEYKHRRNFTIRFKSILNHIIGKIELKLAKYYKGPGLDSLKVILNCYDKIFVGYKKIPGVELQRSIFNEFSLDQKKYFARILAEFLLSIHRLGVEKLEKTNIDIRLFNRRHHASMYKKMRKYVLPKISKTEGQILLKFYRGYINEPENYQYAPCLIHADVCSEHIFFDRNNRSVGIIDFGGVCLGDPDFDFFPIYNDYGIEFLSLVFQYYGRELTTKVLVKFQAFLCDSIAFTIELSKKTNNIEILDYVEPSLKKLFTNLKEGKVIE